MRQLIQLLEVGSIVDPLPGVWFFIAIDLTANRACPDCWEFNGDQPSDRLAYPLIQVFRNQWEKTPKRKRLRGRFLMSGHDGQASDWATTHLDAAVHWTELVVHSLIHYRRIDHPLDCFQSKQLQIAATYWSTRSAVSHNKLSVPLDYLLPGQALLPRREYENVFNHGSFLQAKLNDAHLPVRLEFQMLLNALEGKSFESIEENQAIADMLQELADRLQLRFQCPKCDQPAVLECRQAGSAKRGTFQFRHPIQRRHVNHFSSTKLPALQLIDAPPLLRRRRNVLPKRPR